MFEQTGMVDTLMNSYVVLVRFFVLEMVTARGW